MFKCEISLSISHSPSFSSTLGWLLYAVGKPVFHKSVNEMYGCWLKDPVSSADIDHEKTYVTEENDTHNLYEYPTKLKYRMNLSPRRKYNIPEGFQVSNFCSLGFYTPNRLNKVRHEVCNTQKRRRCYKIHMYA